MDSDIYKIIINKDFSYNIHEHFIKKMKYFDVIYDNIVEPNKNNTYYFNFDNIMDKYIFDIFFKMLYNIEDIYELNLKDCYDLKYICDFFQAEITDINKKITKYYIPKNNIITKVLFDEYFNNMYDNHFGKSILSKQIMSSFATNIFDHKYQKIILIIGCDPASGNSYIQHQIVRKKSLKYDLCDTYNQFNDTYNQFNDIDKNRFDYTKLEAYETFESYFGYIINNFLKLFGFQVDVSFIVNFNNKLHIGDIIIKDREYTYKILFTKCNNDPEINRLYIKDYAYSAVTLSYNLNDTIYDIIMRYYYDDNDIQK